MFKKIILVISVLSMTLFACTGDQGPMGPAGPEGPAGSQGENGTTIVYYNGVIGMANYPGPYYQWVNIDVSDTTYGSIDDAVIQVYFGNSGEDYWESIYRYWIDDFVFMVWDPDQIYLGWEYKIKIIWPSG